MSTVVRSSAGASTVEAALGIATLVTVLVLCLAGITAVSMQLRCVDAAREAARLAARGDERSAADVARRVAPAGAAVRLHRDGEFVIATVTARSHLLPALAIAATGVSAVEPTR
ncbi:TadE family type IV pilus minor pilin [Mycobacterium sp.]|uniref:TadE family type IV pilus minor pilin n=1 Tax=Mycobacterium sp. TaxID=1785 RepID=UPI003D6B1343